MSGAQAGQCRSIYSCGQGSWSGGQFYYYQLEVGISGANPGDIFEIYESDPRLGRTLADLYVRKAGDTLAGDLWYNMPLSNAGSIGVEGTNSSRVALYGYWTHGRVATEYYLPTCAAPYYLGIWDNQSEVGLYQNSSLAPLRVGQPTADSHAATKGYVDSRAIPSTNIADAAVTASKLADGAVSVSKLGVDVDPRYVNAAGDEMTGDLYMNGRAIHYPEVYQGSIYSPSVYSPYLYQPALDYGQLLSDLDANGSTVHGLGAPSQQSDAATKGYVDDSFKGFDYDARYVYIDKYYDGSNGYHGTLQAPYTNFLHALSVMGSNSFYGGMWAPDKPVIYHVANGFYRFPSLQLTGTNHYVRVGIVGRGAFYRNIHEHLNAYGSSVFTEFGTYIDEIVACRIDGPTNWAHAIIYLKDLVVSNVLLISSGYDEVYCDNVVFLSPTNGGEQIYHGLYYVGAMGSPVGNYEALIASSIRPGYFDEVVATNNAMYVSKAGDTMSGALSIAAQLTASNINVSVPDWHVGSEETVGNIIIENTDGKVSARRGHLNLASDSGNIVAQSPLTFSAGAGVRGTGASPGQPISCAACSVSAQVIVTPTTQPLGQWYVVKSNGWFRVDPSWSGFTFDWLVIPASP